METPLLSVIVPTVGRPSLQRTLRSLLRQGDWLPWEAVLVGDTFRRRRGRTSSPRAYELAQSDPRFVYTECDGGLHAWGHPQRNHGATVARGRYLSWLGDDDIYLAGRLPAASPAPSTATRTTPGSSSSAGSRPWKQVYWHTAGFLAQDHIDAECIVCPNVPEKLGTWTNRYQGDYDFIAGTVERWGGVERVVWQPEVIAQAQPHGRRGLDAGGPGGGAPAAAGDGGLMHPEARAFVAAAATRLPPGPVVELGARDFNGSVRDLFPGAPAYVGVDLAPGAGVDVVADAADWRPPPASRPRRRCSAARCWSTPPGAGRSCATPGPCWPPGGTWWSPPPRPGGPRTAPRTGGRCAPGSSTATCSPGTCGAGSRRPASPSPGSRSTPTGATSTPLARKGGAVRLLLVHPGAVWATHDVHTGLLAGLRAQGHEVTEYALSGRLQASRVTLEYLWRKQVREGGPLAEVRPTPADVQYHAGQGAW